MNEDELLCVIADKLTNQELGLLAIELANPDWPEWEDVGNTEDIGMHIKNALAELARVAQVRHDGPYHYDGL